MSNYMVAAIGRKIRKQRTELGLTISKVAELAGVSKGLISKVENGHTIPSLPVLISIVQSLEVNMDEFFNGLPFDPPSSALVLRATDAGPATPVPGTKGMEALPLISQSFTETETTIQLLQLLANGQSKPNSTNAWVFHYLIDGEVHYQLDDQQYTLHQGDSIFFDGRLPHETHNHQPQTAQVLAVQFNLKAANSNN